MSFIADGLLLAGALTAAFYCWILSVRVKGLKDLDTGLGSAIAALSNQVNEMQKALKSTQAVTGASISEMESLADRAEAASNKLRLMLATVEEKRSSKPNKADKKISDEDLELEENVPDDESPTAATGRVKKFPTKGKKTALTEDADETAKEYKGKIGQWRARKLQKEVADRIKERDDPAEREDLVQVLQEILAANK